MLDDEEHQRKRTIEDLYAQSPLVRETPGLNGGTQGMSSDQLLRDEDGDEAHAFIAIDAPPQPRELPR